MSEVPLSGLIVPLGVVAQHSWFRVEGVGCGVQGGGWGV